MGFTAGEAIRFGWETFKRRPWFFVGATLIVLVLFRGLVLRPVDTLAKAAAGLAAGTAAELPKPGGIEELNRLIAALAKLKDKLGAAGAKA